MRVSPWKLFLAFLAVGATSIGGGMLAHIRQAVVVREGWLSEEEFLESYGLCQTVPGLHTTNLAVLIGDRLGGIWGALAALAAIMAPGAGIVLGLSTFFLHGSAPLWAGCALKGVAAVSVALLLSASLKLGEKSLAHRADLQIVLLTFVCVRLLHLSLPLTLILMVPVSYWLKKPQPAVC
jgi:chromate transporter